MKGSPELAQIAFVQEVAHRISIFTRSRVQTLTATDTACRAWHLPMFPVTSRLGSRRIPILILAIQPPFLAMVEGESALARSQVSVRDS